MLFTAHWPWGSTFYQTRFRVPVFFGGFQNDVSEQEQRWGAKSIEGSGRTEHIRWASPPQWVLAPYEVYRQQNVSRNEATDQVSGAEVSRSGESCCWHSFNRKRKLEGERVRSSSRDSLLIWLPALGWWMSPGRPIRSPQAMHTGIKDGGK